jgi:hypothetical protein
MRQRAPDEAVAAVEQTWLRILSRRHGGRRFEMVNRERPRLKVPSTPGGQIDRLSAPDDADSRRNVA